MEFHGYTPEMLIYYHALSPALQQAVQQARQQPQSLEGLSAMAENLAQSGMSAYLGAGETCHPLDTF